MKNVLIFVGLLILHNAQAQTEEELLELAKTYPKQPVEAVDLGSNVSERTFGSGTPYNDIFYTILNTTYMEGETAGYDYFCPADPSDEFPGNRIMLVSCVNNIDLVEAYSGQQGDRIILGTHETQNPFFLSGNDGLDNEWVVIQHFDYSFGHIQLRGSADDYRLIYATVDEGVATEGYFLFYIGGVKPDLIAFIYPCDFVVPPISGNPPKNPDYLCNLDGLLDLNNTDQFIYAKSVNTVPVLDMPQNQFGTAANDLVHGSVTDRKGNIYFYGSGYGNLTGPSTESNELFIIKTDSAGNRIWINELEVFDGALIFDAVVDHRFLYAAGRTFGAIPGFTSAGQWDAILLKLDIETGELVDSDQWGNRKLDGYGNITLDDAGHLYLSGAGSPEDATSTDAAHLLAKHDAATLENIWRVFDVPGANPVFVSEAWGGITYVPSNTRGDGQIIIAGWYMSAGGADSFISVYDELETSSPNRRYTTTLKSAGQEADWILDNTVDSQGNIYVAGYTTGNLGISQGNGDFFVTKYSPQLTNPQFVQWGTPESDGFRKLVIDKSDNLYAVGYTYGDYSGENASTEHTTGDVVVQKFDTNLTRLESIQFGTEMEERGFIQWFNNVLYVAGITEGSLTAPTEGGLDGYFLYLEDQGLEVLSSDQLPPIVITSTDLSNRHRQLSKVSPNPSYGRFKIETLTEEVSSVSITDQLGRTVPFTRLENEIIMNRSASGVYYLNLEYRTKGTFQIKVFIY